VWVRSESKGGTHDTTSSTLHSPRCLLTDVRTYRLACLRALERRGLAPPGPRPLFNMFATEEHLALLGSKVRAKMGHTRQASSGKLELELSRQSSRGSQRQLLS
jgi:hypothetical protein